MRRQASLILLIFTSAMPGRCMAQSAATPDGQGTREAPYSISQTSHLVWMAEHASSSSNRWYMLMNDIDASTTAGWNSGAGFSPIGSSTALFNGVFEGSGFSISNLVVNRPAQSALGLFGYIGPAGVVRNLSLPNVSVTGDFRLGGLAGENRGTVIRCSTTGSIGGSHNMGGLVGDNFGFFGGPARIENSYSRCSVLASGYETGGLVGWNFGVVYRCYAAGAVTENFDDNGGLVGHNNGTVSQSYWDTEASGQSSSAGGTGKTTMQMQQKATFEDWGFENVWLIQEYMSYPFISDIVAPEILYLSIINTQNAELQWSAIPDHRYTIYSSTNLLVGFSVLHSNILATPPINVYTGSVDGVSARFWKLSGTR